jgi:putative transcriptional regulator
MQITSPESGYLQGHLLLAMPTMTDPRFARSVIFMCAHSAAGAMGLVINKVLDNITFADLLQQLGIDAEKTQTSPQVHFGGPVEPGRGFVLHSADYVREGTMLVGGEVGLTATIDVVKALASGQGPRRSLLALGYAGWGAGQLDAEIQANGWLHAPADEEIIFGSNDADKWQIAVNKVGIDPGMLSTDAGHA